MSELTERIDALYAKATKGPLEQRYDLDYYQGGLYIGRDPYHYVRNAKTGLGEKVSGRLRGGEDCHFEVDVARVESQEDADFLVALVTEWPQIKAEIERLERDIAAMARAVREANRGWPNAESDERDYPAWLKDNATTIALAEKMKE